MDEIGLSFSDYGKHIIFDGERIFVKDRYCFNLALKDIKSIYTFEVEGEAIQEKRFLRPTKYIYKQVLVIVFETEKRLHRIPFTQERWDFVKNLEYSKERI